MTHDPLLLILIERREAALLEELQACQRRFESVTEIGTAPDGRVFGLAYAWVGPRPGGMASHDPERVGEALRDLDRAQTAYLAVKRLHDDALRVLRKAEEA